jgi:hypothetical protein
VTTEEMKEIRVQGIPKGRWIKYMGRFDTEYQYAQVVNSTPYGIESKTGKTGAGNRNILFEEIIEVLNPKEYPEWYI